MKARSKILKIAPKTQVLQSLSVFTFQFNPIPSQSYELKITRTNSNKLRRLQTYPIYDKSPKKLALLYCLPMEIPIHRNSKRQTLHLPFHNHSEQKALSKNKKKTNVINYDIMKAFKTQPIPKNSAIVPP